MIILDTNVISELMSTNPDHRVTAWLSTVDEQVVTTVITRAEILAGVATLPEGRRKTELFERAVVAFDRLGVCLPLTFDCTDVYANIVASRRRAGRPIASMDALIAAITRANGASLATRNIADFEDLDIQLINPWGA